MMTAHPDAARRGIRVHSGCAEAGQKMGTAWDKLIVRKMRRIF